MWSNLNQEIPRVLQSEDSEIKMGMTGATMATTEEGAYALAMIELRRAGVRKENQVSPVIMD
jgi:L-lactate utilization protein LutB